MPLAVCIPPPEVSGFVVRNSLKAVKMNKYLSLDTAYPQGPFEGSKARKCKIIPRTYSFKEDIVSCSES